MELRKLKQLVQMVARSGIQELDIQLGKEQIRIHRGSAVRPAPTEPPQAICLPQLRPQAPAGAEDNLATAQRAPMPGSCYLASAPGAAPFVSIGHRVQAGDPLCLIEAMKLMNTIEAERSGVVRAILIADGAAVQTGTPLFCIE